MACAPRGRMTGFGMAGDERVYACAEFAPVFQEMAEAGFRLTAHAGEWGGPESVRAALDEIRQRPAVGAGPGPRLGGQRLALVGPPLERADRALRRRREEGDERLDDGPDAPGRLPVLRVEDVALRQIFFPTSKRPDALRSMIDGGLNG